MIILGVEQNDDIITGLGKRYLATCRAALKDAVWEYHKTIFPRHFFNSNRSRYKHETRSQYYLQVIKRRRGIATGKFVDQILTGVSRRRMLAFATVRASDGGNTVTLRMSAPRYFTNPYVGTFRNPQGQVKRIMHQPDKAKEVAQVNQEDQASLTQITTDNLMARFNQIKSRGSRRKLS